LEFALSFLAAASDEQYESILDDEIALLVRSSMPCTSSVRRGVDHPGASSSVAIPSISSPTTPSGKYFTPPTSTTTPTGMTTTTKAITRRRTALETRRRSYKRSCPEHVLP
jgi:hypothetical protein